MLCIKCGNDKTQVTDSRDHKYGRRRRRVCLVCGEKFTTYETTQKRRPQIDALHARRAIAHLDRLRLLLANATKEAEQPT